MNSNQQFLYYIYFASNRKVIVKRTNGTSIFEKRDEDTGSCQKISKCILKSGI